MDDNPSPGKHKMSHQQQDNILARGSYVIKYHVAGAKQQLNYLSLSRTVHMP